MTLSLTQLIKNIKSKVSSCESKLETNTIKNITKQYLMSDLSNSNSGLHKHIIETSGTNLPIRIGLTPSSNVPISFSGLKAISSQIYMYLGGHTTKLRAETINLTANATNYIYITTSDPYEESRIVAHTSAQTETFNKKLICTAITNGSSVTSRTFVSFTNYNGG